MKKNFNLIFMCLVLILIILNCNISFASNFDKLEGHFEVITTKEKIIGNLIKLKDGRVLGNGKGEEESPLLNKKIYIFDPKTYKITKLGEYNSYLENANKGIMLNNGKILYVCPYIHSPESEFNGPLGILIRDKVISDYRNNNKTERPATMSIPDYRSKVEKLAWQHYKNLSKKEREQIFMPFLKENPELLQKYKEYEEKYKKSMYAQLLDPVTGKFEYTGKVNIRRNYTNKILLKNGNVLIWGGVFLSEENIYGNIEEEQKRNESIIEMYNPQTGLFSVVNDTQKINFLTESPIFLDDGRIFYYGTIYNPENNTFFQSEYKNHLRGCFNFIKLKNGNILLSGLSEGKHNSIIEIYNPNTDELKKIGDLLIPRGEKYSMTLYNDDIALIYDGTNYNRCDYSGCYREERMEIFNISTGEQKVLKLKLKEKINSPIKLDDNRIMFLSNGKIKLFSLK